jgi:transcriptional regulator with XRE-family HTH domain
MNAFFKEHKISKGRLLKLTGISITTLNKMLTRKRQASIDVILKLHDALLKMGISKKDGKTFMLRALMMVNKVNELKIGFKKIDADHDEIIYVLQGVGDE